MPILSRVIKGVGAGIGLASEAIADHKEKKTTKERGVSPQPPVDSTSRATSTKEKHTSLGKEKADNDYASDSSSSDESNLETDRAEWALDEAAQELEEGLPAYSEAVASTPISAEEVAKSFLQTHNLSSGPEQTYTPLPNPVILPQRRPKDKSRGFVRAYPPLLGACSGIDQKTFIDFLNEFDRASKASPVFDVINLAAFAVGFIPNPITMAVSISVQVAAGTAQEIQSRYRRNTYLDQINETLFKPRGLYCMIMTFKPDNPHNAVIGLDVTGLQSSDQALIKATSNPESEVRQKLKNIRLTSGKTKGEMSLPESAPLVYPALDAAAQAALEKGTEAPEKDQNALKSAGAFMSTYFDRRAQAAYAGKHPGSKLALPPAEKKFASRFSDPNHPANSGTILGLLTGGKFDPKAKRRGRRAQRRAERRGYELSEADIKNAEMGRLPRRRKGIIGRVLHKNVLYLTVVNLPSEGEMKEMMQEFERLKNQH